MTHILTLKEVVKRYHNNTAVDGVSFNVKEGSIFGLLGPNGAGKTSLIRIITTITGADEGEVLLNGERLNSNHPSQIGYMPEERGLYKKMKVGEQLLYLAQLKGMPLAEAKISILSWMDKFEIRDWWNKKVEELSKGMQQKIQFIATVMHQPKLLILDEPFSGLDPVNTNLIKKEISELRDKGVSIIFSTHRMEQVEEICEEIVLINHGKKILEGRVSDIKENFKENKYFIEFEGNIPETAHRDTFEVVTKAPDHWIIQIREGHDSNEFLRILIESDVRIKTYKELLPTLNQIFIKQVQGESHE